jgi:predicted ATPase
VVPTTVQGIIAARIDRLEPGRRRLLQTASVVGQRFYRSIIGQLEPNELESSLEELKERDLISEAETEPDVQYMFKHALMRDVVYGSLLHKDRRLIHARVAAIIETAFAPRIEEFFETLAYHYRQSGDTRKAVDYLMKAGKKSLSRYSAAEANDFYREAYELFTESPEGPKDPDTLIALVNGWSYVLYYYGDFNSSVELHERHLAEADRVADPELRGMFQILHAPRRQGFARRARRRGGRENRARGPRTESHICARCVRLARRIRVFPRFVREGIPFTARYPGAI